MTPARESHQPLDDQDLCRRIQASLSARRPELARLQVRVVGGTVHLAGRLPTFHARQIAVSVASHVAGVRHIVDEIVVPARLPARG